MGHDGDRAVNKLRVLSRSSALALSVLCTWAAVRYGSPFRFVPGALTAGVIIVLPSALAHGKLWARRSRRYVIRRRRDDDRVTTFVAENPDSDPESALSKLAAAIERDERYRTVRSEEFPEGEGLLVMHGGFDGSFVRHTEEGRLVVTGASENTRALARHVADLRGVSMRERSNNPFFGPIPVRGGPRVLLSVLLVVALVLGVGSVADAAYPSDAYNTPERAVLVSHDARADFVPGVSRTDAQLDKAAFMVRALAEEGVEIRWEENGSRFLVEDARQALAISADVRASLRTVREGSPSDAQVARTDRIEADLHVAERKVANAITARLEDGTTGQHAPELRTLQNRLRRVSERPV